MGRNRGELVGGKDGFQSYAVRDFSSSTFTRSQTDNP